MGIHSTAIVDSNAEIDSSADIGPYCIIGPNVRIGSGTRVMSHVTIRGHVTIGSNCILHECSVIGGEPQDLKYGGEKTELIIGDHNIIREYATINPGTVGGGGKTVIGAHNLIMTYVHIAHDCRLENHIVLANCVQLGGHALVEEGARVSALVGVHHFTTIGALSFVSGLAKITRDVPPFMIVDGQPAKVRRLNEEGLRRKMISDENKAALKSLFRLLYRSGLNRHQATEKAIQNGLDKFAECRYLLDFLERTGVGAMGRGLEANRHHVDIEQRDGDFRYKASFDS